MAQNSITYTDSYTRKSRNGSAKIDSNKNLNDYDGLEKGLKSSETLLKSPKKPTSRNQLNESAPPSAVKPAGIVAVPRLNISKLAKYDKLHAETKSVEDYNPKKSGKYPKSKSVVK